MRKWLRDLGVAFDNLWRALVTPREALESETEWLEFVQKMRALGGDPAVALHWAAMLTAAGATTKQVEVFFKIIAKGRIEHEDLWLLAHRDIDVRPVQRRG